MKLLKTLSILAAMTLPGVAMADYTEFYKVDNHVIDPYQDLMWLDLGENRGVSINDATSLNPGYRIAESDELVTMMFNFFGIEQGYYQDLVTTDETTAFGDLFGKTPAYSYGLHLSDNEEPLKLSGVDHYDPDKGVRLFSSESFGQNANWSHPAFSIFMVKDANLPDSEIIASNVSAPATLGGVLMLSGLLGIKRRSKR